MRSAATTPGKVVRVPAQQGTAPAAAFPFPLVHSAPMRHVAAAVAAAVDVAALASPACSLQSSPPARETMAGRKKTH